MGMLIYLYTFYHKEYVKSMLKINRTNVSFCLYVSLKKFRPDPRRGRDGTKRGRII